MTGAIVLALYVVSSIAGIAWLVTEQRGRRWRRW
jgi:hypothetical protein